MNPTRYDPIGPVACGKPVILQVSSMSGLRDLPIVYYSLFEHHVCKRRENGKSKFSVRH
jgi:hypothetical protein